MTVEAPNGKGHGSEVQAIISGRPTVGAAG